MYTEFHGTGSPTWPDKVIRERYFPDYGYAGVYLDVGAAGPISMSNSYHFRRNGWKILPVEANPEFCKAYREMGFTIAECAVGATLNPAADFSILTAGPESASSLGGADKDWAKVWAGFFGVKTIVEARKKIIKVQVMTLDEVMQKFFPDVTAIDTFDLDIELGEMDALAGFDIARFSPKLCLIEDHSPSTTGIEKHMNDRGYKLDLRIAYDSYYLRKG